MSTPTETLAAQGVSIWLDDLSRDRITTGNLNELIRTRTVTGVTTNPTIFAAAIGGSTAYSQQIAEYTARGATVDDTIFGLTTDDVRDACDIFRPVYDATAGVDGRVSIEVAPPSPTTPREPSPRPRSSTPASTGQTCSSRSPQPRRACRRSKRSSPPASPSTSL